MDRSENVPPRVLRLYEAPDNDAYFSAASAWEIAVRYAIKRLGLAHPPERFVPDQREAHGILSLAIDEASALHMSRLPILHRDPFDRLLVGHAIVHGLTIFTPDPLIAQYPARVIW